MTCFVFSVFRTYLSSFSFFSLISSSRARRLRASSSSRSPSRNSSLRWPMACSSLSRICCLTASACLRMCWCFCCSFSCSFSICSCCALEKEDECLLPLSYIPARSFNKYVTPENQKFLCGLERFGLNWTEMCFLIDFRNGNQIPGDVSTVWIAHWV